MSFIKVMDLDVEVLLESILDTVSLAMPASNNGYFFPSGSNELLENKCESEQGRSQTSMCFQIHLNVRR